MSGLFGKYPGIVVSYDGASRMCRVNIPGITDADVYPLATLSYSLGDNPATTEIRIVPGDMVWIEFEAGDPRFPIVVNYRTPRQGNPVDWRRWRHKNIQLIAEDTYLITIGATTITVTDGLMKVTGADLEVSGNIKSGKSITAAIDIKDQGGAKSMAGMRAAYQAHTHTETNTTTSTPNNSM
jgi:phage baseplate assembly protein gpV